MVDRNDGVGYLGLLVEIFSVLNLEWFTRKGFGHNYKGRI